ncbi:DUF3192 domain-containing protein [Aliiglaciecola litoralis]|uniref:DUF3192 domain-containing protein n=1 Tax=Aliiglaciecola litoralis TaxID=582857 RepID=A0ABP3WUV9_9ALTE
MKKLLTAAALILPLTLSGCVISVGGEGDYSHHSDWQDIERDNRKHVASLETNTTVSAIKSRMGTPDFSELHQRGDDEIRVLFYRTHLRDGDGITTKDECTPLVFKNGKLVGWGDTAYDQI